MKKYLKAAIIYAIIGLSSGVFYRELTKILDYTDRTRLSLIHGHYVSLGLFFFLFLLVLEKQFSWSKAKNSKLFVTLYHIGLNVSGIGFLMRGLTEVLDTEMSKGLSASISGISGIGHILLAVSILMILVRVGKSIQE